MRITKRKAINFDALADAAGTTTAPVQKLQAKASGKAPSRANTVQIGAHVLPEKRQKLKLISIETETLINELMNDALDLLFAKYKK